MSDDKSQTRSLLNRREVLKVGAAGMAAGAAAMGAVDEHHPDLMWVATDG